MLPAAVLLHGDPRANNVLIVGDGDRVCLLDFDWAGPVGQQRYPAFMNHTQIDWPEGASDDELIQMEHDNAWLARLLGD